ncbi:MAG TPA: FAD-dependent oxidoreductase [Candidatus Acidoferrales bacterium]|nr:FAD-dependent oxidoreductase [Candidatus Acidoferrales bacterium]
MNDQGHNFDTIIIGAGPAGLTAAIYSSWLGLDTVVLDAGVAGGKASEAHNIENFPGFEEGIKGRELTEKMRKQAVRFGAKIIETEEVVGLDLNGAIKRATTRKRTYLSRAVIIATGTQKRKLRVPGETEFLGRGVSYCVVCDGPFFRNAGAAVIGNGQEAAIDALFLADIAKRVTIVTHSKELKVEGALDRQLRDKANVEIINGQVAAILGDKIVKSIRIIEKDSQREIEKDVNGVFISLGGVPMTEVVKRAGLKVDKNGCLTVDRMLRTNVEGVYAAGDCTCGGMQVVTATGEGAMAAMKVSAYVRGKGKEKKHE